MSFDKNTVDLSAEQKVVLYLAKMGYLTSVGDVTRALSEHQYAEFLVTGNGLKDEGLDKVCEHNALTNEEIQMVFDNDEE